MAIVSARRGAVGVACLVAAAALWGCWSIVFRTAERLSVAPLSAAKETAVVHAVAALLLLPLARRRRAAAPTGVPRRGPRALLLLGVLEAFNALCFFAAMQLTTVAVAVLCHYLTPVIVAVLSPVVLGEARRRSTLLALGLALSGLVLVLAPWQVARPGDLAGAGLAALSACFYAGTVFVAKAQATHFSPVELGAWPKLASVPLLLAVAAATSGDLVVEPAALAVLVIGGVCCGVGPTLLFYAGLARIAASQASGLTLVEPLTAVAVSVAVWGEPLSPLAAVGAVGVLAGAVIIARDGARG